MVINTDQGRNLFSGQSEKNNGVRQAIKKVMVKNSANWARIEEEKAIEWFDGVKRKKASNMPCLCWLKAIP